MDLYLELRYLFLLLACVDELLLAPDNTTLLSNSLPSHNEKDESTSNPIPYPDYGYLSGSTFLINWTAVKKKIVVAKLLVYMFGHIFSLSRIYKHQILQTIHPRLPVIFCYFNPSKAGLFESSFLLVREINLVLLSLHISRKTNLISR